MAARTGMSRTTMCVVTAAVLALGSLAVMVARHRVLGDDVAMPLGPEAWKITLIVHGRTTGDAQLLTATPLATHRQHILDEHHASESLAARPVEPKHLGRRGLVWSSRPGAEPGPFEARYECFCSVQPPRPGVNCELTRHLYAPPQPGQHLKGEPAIEADHPEVAAASRRVTPGREAAGDVVDALFRFVDREVANEPTVLGAAAGALDCLRQERGDAAAKSRLLVARCRNRGVPARLGPGLTLA